MKIKIRLISDYEEFVEVMDTATVLELKALVLEQFSIRVENQRLIYQGRILEDTKTLQFYNITENSVIYLISRQVKK